MIRRTQRPMSEQPMTNSNKHPSLTCQRYVALLGLTLEPFIEWNYYGTVIQAEYAEFESIMLQLANNQTADIPIVGSLASTSSPYTQQHVLADMLHDGDMVLSLEQAREVRFNQNNIQIEKFSQILAASQKTRTKRAASLDFGVFPISKWPSTNIMYGWSTLNPLYSTAYKVRYRMEISNCIFN